MVETQRCRIAILELIAGYPVSSRLPVRFAFIILKPSSLSSARFIIGGGLNEDSLQYVLCDWNQIWPS